MTGRSLRETIASITAPKADLLDFDPDSAPDDPLTLFEEWLAAAVERGALQPNAVTLATASDGAVPSARTVLLKDVDDRGFWFATLSSSPKGEDIRENPRAALTFYWPQVARQVRVTGVVAPGPREVSDRDFRARHPAARAQAIAGEQSAPMPEDLVVAERVASARALLQEDPDFVPEVWSAYVVTPQTVEFWQATPEPGQVRVRYRHQDGGWVRERLWP